MRVLYIGQNSGGTTSHMRAGKIRNLLAGSSFDTIDTHIPFYKSNVLVRSLGFRFKTGPLIRAINKFVLNDLQNSYDLIWVDKGVFLKENTTKILREKANVLVHYTPDPAFTFHKSAHFIRSLKYYDYLVTTKSYEMDFYKKYVTEDKVLYVTQGFDKGVHAPLVSFEDKKKGVIFIGHYEKERGELVKALLEANIPVGLAGIKWNKFASKFTNSSLNYYGEGIYKEAYVSTLSSYQFGLGLVSKWVPELHTTRTFEIPACGTALLTEKNVETARFFTEEEAIFFQSAKELVDKIKLYQANPEELKRLTFAGTGKVYSQGYDYESIMAKVLELVLASPLKVQTFK